MRIIALNDFMQTKGEVFICPTLLLSSDIDFVGIIYVKLYAFPMKIINAIRFNLKTIIM